MDVSGETADLLIREGVQATEGALKLTGACLKNVTALLIAISRQDHKVVGKTSSKRLARDPGLTSWQSGTAFCISLSTKKETSMA